jgi:hypothetical protein
MNGKLDVMSFWLNSVQDKAVSQTIKEIKTYDRLESLFYYLCWFAIVVSSDFTLTDMLLTAQVNNTRKDHFSTPEEICAVLS